MSDIFAPGKYPLFDKLINIKLFTTSAAAGQLANRGETVNLGNGQVVGLSDYIQCPSFGQKPSINIQGYMNEACVIQDCDIRITNLLTGDTPLTAYKKLKIDAGYAGQQKTTIECEVNNAYPQEETPGPDGITIFKSFLGCSTNWTNGHVMSQQWTTVNQRVKHSPILC